MLRHVGKLVNTDSKCVVVMMQIPGKEDHALIIESDSLPDHYHQHVMDVVESKEGQNDENLSATLGRRYIFIEGVGNKNIMQALHEAGYLRAEPVSNVSMMPDPGHEYDLKTILETQGRLRPTVLDPNQMEQPVHPEKFNPIAHNIAIEQNEKVSGAARGMIIQAELLERDAAQLRAKAYGINPTLRPSVPTPVTAKKRGRPPKTDTKRPRGRPKKVANA